MNAADLPTRFPIPFANAAASGDIRPIPVDSQISVQAGAASLTDGFPPVCFIPVGAGGTPPFGQDFNGLLLQITQWVRWFTAGGMVPWDSSFATSITGYQKGALIASNTPGYAWYSTVDANVTDPSTGSPFSPAAGWAAVALVGGTMTTGAWTWRPTSEALPGWTVANGLTIGNTGSGATQLADPSAFDQFSWLWAKFSNPQCPVLPSGRGISALADWTALKTIATLDLKGTTIEGVDTMGGGATTRLTGVPSVSGNATTPGSILGENLHSLIDAENGPHNHTYSYFFGNQAGNPGGNGLLTFGTSGTTSTSGSGTAHNTTQRIMTGYHYFKL